MKKLVASILVGAMLLFGCASLSVSESDVCKDTTYYVTSPAGKTQEFCPEEEYPIVREVREANKEDGLIISLIWIDYANNAVALQYSMPNEDPMCVVFGFDAEDLPVAITEDYHSVQPIGSLMVPCEVLVGEAVGQTARDK